MLFTKLNKILNCSFPFIYHYSVIIQSFNHNRISISLDYNDIAVEMFFYNFTCPIQRLIFWNWILFSHFEWLHLNFVCLWRIFHLILKKIYYFRNNKLFLTFSSLSVIVRFLLDNSVVWIIFSLLHCIFIFNFFFVFYMQ